MPVTSSLSKLQELLPQLFTSAEVVGQRYLRFQLKSNISALLSMEQVQESLVISSQQITPLPKMHPSVMGLTHSRDSVFCLVDLLQLMGVSSLSVYSRNYHVIVLKVSQWFEETNYSDKELFLGIAVSEIQGITRVLPENVLSLEQIKSQVSEDKLSFPDIEEAITSYIKGCVTVNQELLMILDFENIIKNLFEQK